MLPECCGAQSALGRTLGLAVLAPLAILASFLEPQTASQLRFRSLALAGFGLSREFGGAFADVVVAGELGGAFEVSGGFLLVARAHVFGQVVVRGRELFVELER